MEEAEVLNQRGMAAEEGGNDAEAEQLYRMAVDADPTWSAPAFNLGLLCKRQSRWDESLKWSLRAGELKPDDQAPHWNAGIAATALGLWDAARAAWTRAGVRLHSTEGPVAEDFGRVPIRLNPESNAEVVWCDRIGPARAVILNIPYKDSGFRCGDVVLHDGAPNGERVVEGRTYHVFDCLQLLTSSGRETQVWRVVQSTGEPLDSLHEALEQAGVDSEAWSKTVRTLCRSCSEGSVHQEHDDALEEVAGFVDVAISLAPDADVEVVLKNWTAAGSGRRVSRID